MAATDEHPVTSTHSLTRRNVAERLGVSVSTVRRMEGQTLHPIRDDRGVWRFAEAEVRKLGRASEPHRAGGKATEDGDLAARVFTAFSNGFGLREIVIELRVHPSIVRELYTQWSTGLQAGERRRRDEVQRTDLAREERDWKRWQRGT